MTVWWLPFLFSMRLVPGDLGPIQPRALTCPTAKTCLAVDADGAIFAFHEDRPGWRLRGQHAGMDLRKAVFFGLFRGAALDQTGTLWVTRDGGRGFQRLPGPTVARAVDVAAGEALLALLEDGRIVELSGGLRERGRVSGRPQALAARGRRLAALAAGDLQVFDGAKWRRLEMHAAQESQPACSIAIGDGGEVAVLFPDRILAWSGESVEPEENRFPADRQAPGCPRAAVFLDGNTWLVVDGAGEVWLCDRPNARLILAGVEGGWSLAAPIGPGQALLLGDRGRWGRAERVGAGKLGLSLSRSGGPDIRAIQADAASHKAVRALADGTIEASTTTGNGFVALGRVPARPRRLRLGQKGLLSVLSEDSRLFLSRDAGRTWNESSVPASVAIHDMAWTSRGALLAVGDAGTLIVSADGGQGWQPQTLPANGASLRRVQVVADRTVFVAGERRLLFASHDGGRNFSRLLEGEGTIRALFFLDEREGWIGGDSGAVLHTTDGGARWTACPLPAPAQVRELWFDRKLCGAALSDAGLFITIDGGTSWTLAQEDGGCGFSAFACLDASTCFLGGACGRFMVGNPWSR